VALVAAFALALPASAADANPAKWSRPSMPVKSSAPESPAKWSAPDGGDDDGFAAVAERSSWT
jgi:hypothetical protein